MPAWDVGKGTTKQSYDAGRTGNHNTNGVADNNRESYKTSNAYKVEAKKAAKISKANKIKQDMVDFKNYSYQPPTGLAKFSPLAQGLHITGLGKKGFDVNKSYYEKNLIGKTNLATGKAYSASIDDYKSYMSARGSGSIDAMGREVVGGNGGGQLVEKNIGGRTLLTTAPTTAEVSQSNAAQVEDSEELRKKRVKAKGRSPTIMTGVTGVTGGLTLGKPSLLGRA